MSAYIIVDIAAVKDPAAYEEYKAKAPALVHKHGGEYLVRGGKSAVAEGDWRPNRIVVLRFKDMDAIRSFYDDPEYEPLKALRQRATATDMVFVEGI